MMLPGMNAGSLTVPNDDGDGSTAFSSPNDQMGVAVVSASSATGATG